MWLCCLRAEASFEIFYSFSLPEIGVDVVCLSPTSTGCFIVSDDESSGE